VNDVTRLQALVDKKKVVVIEAVIREVLWLDDAEGVDCLPNKEIFTELARMGYEKPSTKLTFYKAFFSSHSAMASAVICLSTGRRFNFSKYIFDSLVGDLSTHTTKYASPALTQKVFTNMRRVGKGFSGVETPLFEGMLVGQAIEEEGDADAHIKDATAGDDTQGDDIAAHGEVLTVTQEPSIPSLTPTIPPSQPPQDIPSTSQVQQTPPQSPQVQPPSPQPQAQQQAVNFPISLLQEALDACAALTRRVEHLEVDTSDDTMVDDESNQGRMIDKIDKDDVVVLMDEKEEDKKVEEAKVNKSAQVQGRQAESQAKIYKIYMDHASKVLITAASVIISAAEPQVPITTITVASAKVAAALSKRRKGVVIMDPEEESTTSSIISTKTKSKDKGKGIMVEESKPLKKKQQIEIDKEYARKLHAELKKDIDWDVAIDHVKLKAKEDPAIQRYHVMKRKPQIEAQARKNMMMYLKNIKEQIKEEENRALQSINETPAQKAAKMRKLNKEVEDLKRHLEIVPDEDDDVYTEATLLARKVPVVDYKIIKLNNKPYYKIIRANGMHQLYISFLTLLKNFDREDLEALWSLVKERFSTSKHKNFYDDFLLTTLRAMFLQTRCTGSSLEESKDYTWSSKGQELEATRIMWCAYHNLYNYAANFVNRKKVPTLKVYSRPNAE
nr:hypothetical protein [Tanacetum cinerariifolium]